MGPAVLVALTDDLALVETPPFPAGIIRHAVWLYARFMLSYRDVEEMLAERGVDVSYGTVRAWFLKFGPVIAANLRRMRPRPSDL